MPRFACARIVLPGHVQHHRHQQLIAVRAPNQTYPIPTSAVFDKDNPNCLIRESFLAYWGLSGNAVDITFSLIGTLPSGQPEETTDITCKFIVKSDSDFDLIAGNQTGVVVLGLLLGEPFCDQLKSVSLYRNGYQLQIDGVTIRCKQNTSDVAR